MEDDIKILEAYNIATYNKSLALLYRHFPALRTMDFVTRVVNISAIYMGRPYLMGANGEGHAGQFDQSPLYRFDAFDCVTYLNTILALALSDNIVSFKKNLLTITYRNAQPSYAHRHHFMSADWNQHNQQLNIVKDITAEICQDERQLSVQYAEAYIDRPNWFRTRRYSDLHLLQTVSDHEAKTLLAEIHAIGDRVDAVDNRLPYWPITEMFDDHASPRMEIFNRIPQGAIIEIVRPDWQVKDKIGTNLNVSHVGFAVWQSEQLYYRQASSIEQRVIDIPLVDYLRCRLVSPSIKGINIQALVNSE